MKYKEPLIIAAITLLIIFAISLITIKDFLASIKLSFSYIFLFNLPIVFFISKIKEIDLLEKSVLTNILGVSYASIYFILDVALKVPLTKTLFIITAVILTILGFLFYNKKDKSTTNLKEPESSQV